MSDSTLCPKCAAAIDNIPSSGPGGYIDICSRCSIQAAAEYINNQRKKMEIVVDSKPENGLIKSKRTLHSRINECLDDMESVNGTFPFSMTFQETMSSPLFTITIEKKESDFFVDEKGQKWVKAE
jgi:hypothetical protein